MFSQANEALYATHKTKYTLGTSPQILYTLAGNSQDWVTEKLGVK